ncbi:MAG: ribose-phosphate diphosphokinase [Bacilli bacterium]
MKKDNLRLVVLNSSSNFGKLVNEQLKLMRNTNFNYIVPIEEPKFANSEGKTKILQSVRGCEVFILADVGNYEQKYEMFGYTNRTSYNDNFMAILNSISACAGTADKIWVIEPLLYGSRQHKREGRESLTCAQSLHILEFLGVKGIISYDVHDPTVRSALNRTSFDNLYPTNTMLEYFLENEDIDFNNLTILNPDLGATKRANYFGKILQCPIGAFTKERDTSIVLNGQHPIKSHKYIGSEPLNDKNIIIVDDMIASGDSMIDTARMAKEEGANKIFLFATFGLFSNGNKSIEMFNEAYKNNIIDKVYVTNLSYIPERISTLPWIEIVDFAPHLAKVIHTLNQNESIEPLMNGKEEVTAKILQKKLLYNK